jgi:hypothetical protein
MWFVFQLISGLGMLGGSSDGVAYAAHIGGFGVGVILIKPFARMGPGVQPNTPWEEEKNERREERGEGREWDEGRRW